MLKKTSLIFIVLLAILMTVGCDNPFKSNAENAFIDIQAIDKAKADVDKLGDRYSQGAEVRLRAEIEKLKAQIATKSSGRHVHVCVPACVQHPAKPAPAPIVVQPVVVQPTPIVVTQPAPQPTQAPEVCDPCQGREVIIVPCSNWRDCNPPTP